MDVVYSITCHENPKSFIDFIKNINYFNRNLKICIIVHANDYMFKELNGKVDHLNPIHYNRSLYNIDIFKSHIENFDYAVSKGIGMKYFIPLASNCYFHKFITLNYIKSLLYNAPMVTSDKNVDWCWWPNVLLNKKNKFKFRRAILVPTRRNYSSPKNSTKKSDHVRTYDIYNNVEADLVFEEYLFATIYSNLTAKQPQTICKVFWDIPNATPSLKEIIACQQPCVKRVSRDYKNSIRIHFRELTNNYTTQVKKEVSPINQFKLKLGLKWA